MNAGDLRCDELETLAPEIALGTISGPERADAVAHLTSCSACQQRVAELAQVVDAMLLVAPEDDPSDGLAAGVLAQTVGEPTRNAATDRRRRRRLLIGLAGVAAIVAVLIAVVLTRDDDRADHVRTALAVTDGGASVCRAVINDVDPAWLFVSLDEAGEPHSTYEVELHLDGGRSIPVGRLNLRDGHGALAVTIDLDDERARAVRLIDSRDAAEYEATFG